MQKFYKVIGNGFSDFLSYPDEDEPSVESKLELLRICMEQLITDLKNRFVTLCPFSVFEVGVSRSCPESMKDRIDKILFFFFQE